MDHEMRWSGLARDLALAVCGPGAVPAAVAGGAAVQSLRALDGGAVGDHELQALLRVASIHPCRNERPAGADRRPAREPFPGSEPGTDDFAIVVSQS